MKTALILGFSGGFGRHVAMALMQEGYEIRAMLRNPAEVEVPDGIEITAGDMNDHEALRRAAQGADILVYGVNPPYHRWRELAMDWLNSAMQVAEALAMTVVFPANVYIFDPRQHREFSETHAANPVSHHGKIRWQMEQRLKQASENGARVLMLRMGDFIGARAPSTWMAQLVKKSRQGYVIKAAGEKDILHSWAYLPDVANTVVELLSLEPEQAFTVYHFRGYQLSFNDWARIIEQTTGKKVVVNGFPWLAFRVAAIFSPLLRSVFGTRYLWQYELLMDDKKLRTRLESIPYTPPGLALRQTGLI